jgi:hypothetical protein
VVVGTGELDTWGPRHNDCQLCVCRIVGSYPSCNTIAADNTEHKV